MAIFTDSMAYIKAVLSHDWQNALNIFGDEFELILDGKLIGYESEFPCQRTFSEKLQALSFLSTLSRYQVVRKSTQTKCHKINDSYLTISLQVETDQSDNGNNLKLLNDCCYHFYYKKNKSQQLKLVRVKHEFTSRKLQEGEVGIEDKPDPRENPDHMDDQMHFS